MFRILMGFRIPVQPATRQDFAYYSSTVLNKNVRLLSSVEYPKISLEPINLEFDCDSKPIFHKYSSFKDYEFLRDLFTDEKVMKTSTLFACQTPPNEDKLHKAMQLLLEKDQSLRNIYGLQKVKSVELDQYVGVCGLVRTKKNIEGCNSQILEIAIFMRPEFMNSNYGTSSILHFNKRVDELRSFCIASIWEKNLASIKLAKKLGMLQSKTIQKTHQNHTINILTYIKLPNFDIEDLLSTKKVSKN